MWWCGMVAVVPWVVVVVGVVVVIVVVVKVVVGGCAGNGVVQECLATELGLWRRPPVWPSLAAGRCEVVVGGGGLVGTGVVLVGGFVGGGVDAAGFAIAGRDLEPFGGGWSIRLAALRCSSTSSLRAVASDFILGALASVGAGGPWESMAALPNLGCMRSQMLLAPPIAMPDTSAAGVVCLPAKACWVDMLHGVPLSQLGAELAGSFAPMFIHASLLVTQH